MCDAMEDMRKRNQELAASVSDTEAGVQAAQELLLLRRELWDHAAICEVCTREAVNV